MISTLASGPALLAFASGITLFTFVPVLPDWRYLAAVTVLAVVLLRRRATLLAGCMLLGIAWHCSYGQSVLGAEIPAAWAGEPLLVEGRIKGLIDRRVVSASAFRHQFDFEVEQASHRGRPLRVKRPFVLRLNRYETADQSGQQRSAPETLAPNQRWQLSVVLQRPRSLANPGTFDYRLWLLSRGVGGTGKVVTGVDNRLLGSEHGLLASIRHWYQQYLLQRLQGDVVQGLVLALALGDKGALSSEQRRVLGVTGTSHLLVISGLHIGLCALFGYYAGYLIAGFRPRWVQAGTAVLWARVAALSMALCYAAMAGFAVPTQRALIMLLLFLLARQSGRAVAPLRIWLLALVLVLLLDPLAVAAPGFWLSFAAVLLLLAPVARTTGHGRRQLPALAMQWRLTLGLCPLLSLWVGQASLIAPLVNLVAIPFVGFVVVPLLLCALLALPLSQALGDCLLDLAAGAMLWCWQGLTWSASLADGWAIATLYPRPLALLLALLAIALFILPRGTPGRAAWLLLLLPLMLPVSWGRYDHELFVLDVGQGSAVVVRAAGNVMVYDAGPAYASGFNAGTAVLLPFLRRIGVTGIDRLIISHGDTDHSGGARALMRAMPVSLWMAPAAIDAIGSPDIACRAGQRWEWGAVRFSILHPRRALPAKRNDRSCVLLIEAGATRYLLAGDIERATELELARALGPGLSADMLLVPHHGSGSSSSWDFAWFVQPTWAVISAGQHNPFGHPSAPVVRRYHELGAEVVNTADAGALHFTSGQHYAPYRWFYTRYWHNYPCSITASARASWWLGRMWWPGQCEQPPQAVQRAFL